MRCRDSWVNVRFRYGGCRGVGDEGVGRESHQDDNH